MTDYYDDTFKSCPTSNLFELCKGHEMITNALMTSGIEGALNEIGRSHMMRRVILEEMRHRGTVPEKQILQHSILIEQEEDLLAISCGTLEKSDQPQLHIVDSDAEQNEGVATVIDLDSRRGKKD